MFKELLKESDASKIKVTIDVNTPNKRTFKYKGENFELIQNKKDFDVFIIANNHRTHLFSLEAKNPKEALEVFVNRYKG